MESNRPYSLSVPSGSPPSATTVTYTTSPLDRQAATARFKERALADLLNQSGRGLLLSLREVRRTIASEIGVSVILTVLASPIRPPDRFSNE